MDTQSFRAHALAAALATFFASGCGDDHIDTIRVCGLSSLKRAPCSADRCGALGIEYEATVVENVNQNPGVVYCRGGSKCSSDMKLEERPRATHQAWVQGMMKTVQDCFRFVGGRAMNTERDTWPPPADRGSLVEYLGEQSVIPHFLHRDAAVRQVCWSDDDGSTPPCGRTTDKTLRRATITSQATADHVLDVVVAF